MRVSRLNHGLLVACQVSFTKCTQCCLLLTTVARRQTCAPDRSLSGPGTDLKVARHLTKLSFSGNSFTGEQADQTGSTCSGLGAKYEDLE